MCLKMNTTTKLLYLEVTDLGLKAILIYSTNSLCYASLIAPRFWQLRLMCPWPWQFQQIMSLLRDCSGSWRSWFSVPCRRAISSDNSWTFRVSISTLVSLATAFTVSCASILTVRLRVPEQARFFSLCNLF